MSVQQYTNITRLFRIYPEEEFLIPLLPGDEECGVRDKFYFYVEFIYSFDLMDLSI